METFHIVLSCCHVDGDGPKLVDVGGLSPKLEAQFP